MSHRFARNAVSNLSRGGATAVVALVLPPILVRHMTRSEYGVWVLALQAAAYLSYLDFGLQTAVGRYIAFANEKKDSAWRDGIFSTAFTGLSIAGALGFLLVLVLAVASPAIFPSVPAALQPSLRLAILIVGASVAMGLPASAWNGVFVGLQRYDIPAVTVGGGRLLSAIGLIAAAMTGRSLIFMALVVAGTNLLSYALQFGMKHRIAPEIQFRAKLVTAPIVRELSGYCLSLTVWSVCMLLVNGFDVALVGRFQFAAVTPYAVSATLIAFLAGLQNAVFGVIMPHAAALYARQDSGALGDLLVKTTRLGVLRLLLTGLPLILFASQIIGIWIGVEYKPIGGGVLAVLAIANLVRLIGVPYASILIGTGQQRLVVVSPVMEGVSNFIASVFLGMRYGAIGVAWGTLIGAAIGMLAHLFYNLPMTATIIRVSPYRLVKGCLALPVLCVVPALGAYVLGWCGLIGAQRLVQPLLTVGYLGTILLALRMLLTQNGSRLAGVESGLIEKV